MSPKESIGIVETKSLTFSPSGGFLLDCGQKLENVTIAFETYGELDRERANAILIVHALSGDANAAGFHRGARKPGWWTA